MCYGALSKTSESGTRQLHDGHIDARQIMLSCSYLSVAQLARGSISAIVRCYQKPVMSPSLIVMDMHSSFPYLTRLSTVGFVRPRPIFNFTFLSTFFCEVVLALPFPRSSIFDVLYSWLTFVRDNSVAVCRLPSVYLCVLFDHRSVLDMIPVVQSLTLLILAGASQLAASGFIQTGQLSKTVYIINLAA